MNRLVAMLERRRRTGWWVVAVLLATVGVVAVAAGLHQREAPTPPLVTAATAPTSAPSPRAVGARVTLHQAKVPRASAPLHVPVSVPVHLSIPAIAVSRPLLRLGVHADGTVEVPAPQDADTPGWFHLGPTPGQIGSSVILGHVDSLKGPAVFYELRFLHPGNQVVVRLRSGVVAHFTVRRVATYPNADFPAREVYAAHGVRALNLVTCGGLYDRARGGYQSNVVVYTRLTGTSRA